MDETTTWRDGVTVIRWFRLLRTVCAASGTQPKHQRDRWLRSRTHW